jgi:hypothetical protein
VSEAHPQSLNRYAYVQNDPLSLTDPDGKACVTTNQDGSVSIDNAGPIGDACTGNGGIYVPGDLQASDYNALANGQLSYYTSDGYFPSNGPAVFASNGGVGNVTVTTESVTMTIVPESETEDVSGAALIGDALGIIGTVTGRDLIGYVGAGVGLDGTIPNAVITGLSLVPVIGPYVGAAQAFYDVGLATGQFITNHVLAPMFNAAPPQTINANGYSMPNPALMNECQALGGNGC